MEFLKQIYKKLGNYLGEHPRTQYPLYNLGLDIEKRQEHVAFVYSNGYMFSPFDIKKIRHSNGISFFPKLYYFLSHGYVIDLYECHRNAPNIVDKNNKYSVVFGFGKLYAELCKLNPNAVKILYVTENAPWIVEQKYKERIEYYLERHQKLVYNISRTGYYTKEMFELSDYGIAGNGPLNISEMKKVLPVIFPIKISVIFNQKFKQGRKNHFETRKRFVWFGSAGSIHKGLDILIDVFRELPHLWLDIYGADANEIKEFNLPLNVCDCGFVSVSSSEFIENVINSHSFVISLSCSEALQSSVSTCMAHGLIPIITPETGFDDIPNAIICKDFCVDYVKNVVLEASKMRAEILTKMETEILKYTRTNFSIATVNNDFYKIMNSILNNNEDNNNHNLL